jgi:murein DD-endopeptidase MepM/ murein hydrolase activator NlpD
MGSLTPHYLRREAPKTTSFTLGARRVFLINFFGVNNFYTVLVIPEKTKQVKKIVLPSIYVRVGILLGSVGIFFLAFMVYDYVNVMKQLSENKRLQTENRQLKQQMQTFTTKLQTVQDALERIQSYTTKLRIITNQAGENTDQLKKKVEPNIPGLPMDDHSDLPPAKSIPSGHESRAFPLSSSRLLAEAGEVNSHTFDIAEGNEAAPAEPPKSAVVPEVIPAAPPAPVPPPVHKKVARRISKPAPVPVVKTETITASASSTSTATSTSTETSVALSAAVETEPRKLEDLIREDDEQESAALRKDFSKLHQAFDSVLQHELTVELDVESLTTALYDQRDTMNSLPTLKPTNGWYTSGFGVRSSPFTGKSTMHEGLDLANNIGSAIVATAAGVVTYAGPRAGYGNLVTVNHGYGVSTQYGHLSKWYVKVGEKVKRGQKIAAVGNTGRSTGPHVHYEVRVNGIPVDPYFYILED